MSRRTEARRKRQSLFATVPPGPDATRILRDLCGRSAAALTTARGRRLSWRALPSKTRDEATAAVARSGWACEHRRSR
jgi:hypothetical protein